MERKDLAALVFSIDPIITSILHNLSAKDLNAASHVCNLWYRIAQSIKKRRHQIFWTYFTQNSSCKAESCCFKHSAHDFNLELRTAKSEPCMVLVFCSQELEQYRCSRKNSLFHSPKATKRKLGDDADVKLTTIMRTIEDVFQHVLPGKCDVGLCIAPGIIGTLPDNSLTKEIRSGAALTALYFPSIPDVSIYRFPITALPVTDNFDPHRYTSIPPNTTVKCLLVFLNDRFLLAENFAGHKIMNHFINEQHGCLAVGGAVVHQMYFPKYILRRRKQSYAIAFTGNNVAAASVVITQDVDTRLEIKTRLETFGEGRLFDGQCVGFFFSHVDRDLADMEIQIFRELYPFVPLFGVYGYEEIGLDYVPGCALIPETGDRSEKKQFHLCYSTVFVIISVKNLAQSKVL